MNEKPVESSDVKVDVKTDVRADTVGVDVEISAGAVDAQAVANSSAQPSAQPSEKTEIKKKKKTKKKGKKKNKQNKAVRLYAAQLMYSLELNDYELDQELAIYDAEEQPELAIRELSQELLQGFCTERIAIDACVDSFLQNWTLQRLAYMDRAIMRLGCYEIMFALQTAPSIIINEYIELAKQFGSDDKTAKLVNAVLDKIARKHRPDELKSRK